MENTKYFAGYVALVAVVVVLVALSAFVNAAGHEGVNYNISTNPDGTYNAGIQSGDQNLKFQGDQTNFNANLSEGNQNLNFQGNQNNFNTNLQQGTQSVGVQGNLLNAGPGTLQINTSNLGVPGDGSILVRGGDGSLLVDVSGAGATYVSLNNGSLSVQVQNGSLTPSAQASIVSLGGGSALLIQSNADLNAYGNLVVQNRPGVTNVSVNNGVVTVKYNQPARFLGIFGTSIAAEASVNSNGKVAVKMPWYSFLFSKRGGTVKKQVEVTLANETSSGNIQVTTLASGDEQVRVQNSAKVLNVVSSVASQRATLSSGNKSLNTNLNNQNGTQGSLQSGDKNLGGNISNDGNTKDATIRSGDKSLDANLNNQGGTTQGGLQSGGTKIDGGILNR